MKVAVTGGAGFIGRHVVARLLEEGHDTSVLDNLHRSTFGCRELRGARCIDGDIRDRSACLSAFTGCEVVIHLAAQSNVMGSQSDPDYTFGTNVTGTWEVIQAARAAGVRQVIFASSREVYGEPDELPVRESAPLRPHNTYGASKVAGEALLSVLDCTWPRVSIVRLSNVIGPGDTGRVVPLWLQSARTGCSLSVFGGNQVLDLVPVRFVAAAMARIALGPGLDGPLNIASGIPTPILHLARRIIELTKSSSVLEVLPPRGPEVTRFCADITRLRETLQLEPPQTPLEVIEESW